MKQELMDHAAQIKGYAACGARYLMVKVKTLRTFGVWAVSVMSYEFWCMACGRIWGHDEKI